MNAPGVIREMVLVAAFMALAPPTVTAQSVPSLSHAQALDAHGGPDGASASGQSASPGATDDTSTSPPPAASPSTQTPPSESRVHPPPPKPSTGKDANAKAQDAFLKGEIPAQLKIGAPAPLDAVFALVHSLIFDLPDAADPRWAALYKEVRKRDKAYYDAMPEKTLASNDARLPVFAKDAGSYTPDKHAQLQKWAIAYRAGLPDVLEAEIHYTREELSEDSQGAHYVFLPLALKPEPLQKYAEVLKALSIPLEQAVLWDPGGVSMLIIATNSLSLYELPIEKSQIKAVELHTHALFHTGAVEILIDFDGSHLLLMPVQPVGLVVHDDGKMAGHRTYEDVPVNDGQNMYVDGPAPEALSPRSL